jgi:endonuclease G, mitochondrial
MAFNGYLTPQQITELTKAAVSGGLIDVPRQVLLAGIPPTFAATLPRVDSPLDQFTLDLVRVNGVERMAGGEVPAVILLRNAAERLRLVGREEAEVFERALNSVTNAAAGLPRLPDPAELPEVIKNERIIGTDDMVNIGFLAGGLDVAEAVALISVPRFEDGHQVMATGGLPWIASGTAWLIAPGLAITNHHVVNARRSGEADASQADLERQAADASLRFDFDAQDTDGVRVAVTGLVAWCKELDYAVLTVDGAAGRMIPRLASSPVTFDATARFAVNIVQHPGGKPKRVALRNNLVTGADETSIRYFTDTDAGSSGSPVCDDQWRVVALHRGTRYVSNVSYLGKDTAYVNYGIQIQAIVKHLRSIAPATAQAIGVAC